MNNITKIYQSKKFASLKRQLFLYEKIARDNYRGERTIIVLSGLNFNFMELRKTPSLARYEEKFLFFLFLLRFSRTRIIYVVSQSINEFLIDYYLRIISDDEKERKDMRRRLVIVNVKNGARKPVAYKVLKKPSAVKKIESYIVDYKTTYIQCYNPSRYEKEVAIKLGVPLYGVDVNLNYYGTKSGSSLVFKKSKVPQAPGYRNLKTKEDLIISIAKLIYNYPAQRELILKIEDLPAGEGNVIFSIEKLKYYSKTKEFTSLAKIEMNVKKYLGRCCLRSGKLPHKKFSYYFATIYDYFREFEKTGGIVELYLEGAEKYSPSCQVRIFPNRKIRVISTHEQVLVGEFKTEYAGCSFPANVIYRSKITNYGHQVGQYLAKKGVIGRFAVDFLAVKEKKNDKFKLYAIEINLRKGGTTHPYILARSATGALYNRRTGLLSVGKKNIFYYASDNIVNPKWKHHSAKELIQILDRAGLGFDKIKKRGVILHLFGFFKSNGRFGATFVDVSQKRVEKLYQKTIKLLNRVLS